MKMYKDEKYLSKKLKKEDLDEILGDIRLEELFDDLKIEDKEEELKEKEKEGEELDGIEG